MLYRCPVRPGGGFRAPEGASGGHWLWPSETNSHIAKVSVVGAGMINHPGVAATLFEALYDANININMISTSEIKISVLVDEKDAEKAVQVIHDKFFSMG